MKEIWKNIKGYEGLYEVSNLGRVKSLNYNHTRKEGFLKPADKRGYLSVQLFKNGILKWHLVHRLVASAFIENPDNLPQVNHIDQNKKNNKVSNIEWCDSQYNNTYKGKHRKISRKVGCYKDGKLIKVYSAMIDAEKEGFYTSNVCICCQGKAKSYKGYQWKYIE